MSRSDEKYQEWLVVMSNIRFRFPEHGLEIDRCVFDAGQKIEFDSETTFEEFHRMRTEIFSMSASLNGFYPDGERFGENEPNNQNSK